MIYWPSLMCKLAVTGNFVLRMTEFCNKKLSIILLSSCPVSLSISFSPSLPPSLIPTLFVLPPLPALFLPFLSSPHPHSSSPPPLFIILSFAHPSSSYSHLSFSYSHPSFSPSFSPSFLPPCSFSHLGCFLVMCALVCPWIGLV